jgi:DNA-directed RNA polymerase specialized sigma24 family protein
MSAGLTDERLLEQFAQRRGEASELAFAALVERHGPMVLRACRGIVRDEHDAQDAFQATFLILVRRAGALWVRG